MNKPEISTQDMMTAIKKSGYLLEAEIKKYFTSLQGYFVESNQVILDPLTKKIGKLI